MEFIKISREKVKIMLSPEDMTEYNIDCEMLESGDESAREAFREILRAAEEKCGFSSCKKRIFVQIFPSREGGCEMFVTKLNDIEPEERSAVAGRSVCYAFKYLSGLLALCHAAAESGAVGFCEAYADTEHRIFYICFDKEVHFASEFGATVCSSSADAYLKEHCRRFFNGYTSELGKYAG